MVTNAVTGCASTEQITSMGQFENSLVVATHTSHSANKQKTIPMIRKYVGIHGRMTRSANGKS